VTSEQQQSEFFQAFSYAHATRSKKPIRKILSHYPSRSK
jgi:hypothetical protein